MDTSPLDLGMPETGCSEPNNVQTEGAVHHELHLLFIVPETAYAL